MPLALERGSQDEELPHDAEIIVLRACKLPPDYHPQRPLSRESFNFSLSSGDKEQPVPKLSVFVQGLTTEQQVCSLVGDGTTHRLIARLPVVDIRDILVEGCRLNAVWDAAVLRDGTPDTRPGTEGHAGIIGLRPQGVPNAKVITKVFQVRLADVVRDNYTVVDVAVDLAPNDFS